jgi:hypothetical protein
VPDDAAPTPLTEDRRRAAFRALVELQDRGMSVAASREEVVKLYALTGWQVRDIEREGLANQWPPLGDEDPAG